MKNPLLFIKKSIKFKLRKVKHFIFSRHKIMNYYNTNFTQCILICYIVEPFIKMPKTLFHSNYGEALQIAKAFHSLNYNVDIVDYKYPYSVSYKKYSIIFGFGKTFDDSAKFSDTSLKRIFYATEASPEFAISEEVKRLNYFNERHNILFPLERDLGNSFSKNSIISADAIFSVGNHYIASTYSNLNPRFFLINVSGLQYWCPHTITDINTINENRNNFLWFGGVGSIHKGLDLCIETFAKIPNAHLYIAGPVRNEFFDIYKDELEYENIHYLGMLSTHSEDFRSICTRCMYSILPSCSEACSTAVITTMYMGLIPVITPGTGIDIDGIGYLINSIKIQDMQQQITGLCNIDSTELLNRSQKSREYACSVHSIESFYNSFIKALTDCIN